MTNGNIERESFSDLVERRGSNLQLKALADHLTENVVPAVAEAVLNVLPAPLSESADNLAMAMHYMSKLTFDEMMTMAEQVHPLMEENSPFGMASAFRRKIKL